MSPISSIYYNTYYNDKEDDDLYEKIVVFDCDHRKRPHLHFLKGKLLKDISHKIRYDYAHLTKCPYEDTRVISWETFIKRDKMGYKKMPFQNMPFFYKKN